MTRRLTALLDDPETEASVRDVLQAGRDQGVADYDFEAGLARHMAVIQAGVPMPDWAKGLETAGTSGGAGGGAASTTAAATGAGASAMLGGAAWLVVPVVTAAVVAAVMWARQPEPAAPSTGSQSPSVGMHPVVPSASSATPAVQVEAPVAPAPVPSLQVPAEPESGLPSEPERATPPTRTTRGSTFEPRASAAAGKPRVVASVPATSSGSAASSGYSRSSSGDLFAKARPAAASAETADPAPTEQPVREQQVDAASAEPAPKPLARLDDARLEREMGMLAVAQRVMHSDPARTLSLVRQSAREFGDTMFAPERGQLELLALVKLGKLDEAKRLARPYLARYPNGPFSDRVRRALASGRIDR